MKVLLKFEGDRSGEITDGLAQELQAEELYFLLPTNAPIPGDSDVIVPVAGGKNTMKFTVEHYRPTYHAQSDTLEYLADLTFAGGMRSEEEVAKLIRESWMTKADSKKNIL